MYVESDFFARRSRLVSIAWENSILSGLNGNNGDMEQMTHINNQLLTSTKECRALRAQ